jgi:hypothetical protein
LIVALSSDLMGLGMAPALANLEGVTIPAAIAGVGTAQVGAAPLVSGAIHQVTTSAGQTAARLPADQPLGVAVHVYVSTATAALVFPPTGGNINEGAANASFSVAQARLASFYRVSATKWLAQYGA